MVQEVSRGAEAAAVGALVDPATDRLHWLCEYKLEKWSDSAAKAAGMEADEVIERKGNLLVTAGITALLTLLTGGGGSSFSTSNAYIGVGDSATAAAIGQTDLVAATNKIRKLVKQAPTVVTNTATWVADFTSAEANWVWNEFAIFNASAAGVMLNRAVSALGTKAAGSTWTLTVTVTVT